MFSSPHTHASGSALLDAQWDFRRARRSYIAGRLGSLVRNQTVCIHPPTLDNNATLTGGPQRLAAVPLDAIVGTVEPSANFDARFRPASNEVRRRWERIALAHRRGDALPPVVLRRFNDAYYVVDGRHRVSVARTLRHRDIDAWVTGPAA